MSLSKISINYKEEDEIAEIFLRIAPINNTPSSVVDLTRREGGVRLDIDGINLN